MEADEKAARDRKIRKERNKLRKIFAKMDENALKTFEGLIDNCAWMKISLEEMRADIDENGKTELFQQSEKVPAYEKERPVMAQYIKISKNYESAIRTLISKLPKDEQGAAMDDFQMFISRGR